MTPEAEGEDAPPVVSAQAARQMRATVRAQPEAAPPVGGVLAGAAVTGALLTAQHAAGARAEEGEAPGPPRGATVAEEGSAPSPPPAHAPPSEPRVAPPAPSPPALPPEALAAQPEGPARPLGSATPLPAPAGGPPPPEPSATAEDAPRAAGTAPPAAPAADTPGAAPPPRITAAPAEGVEDGDLALSITLTDPPPGALLRVAGLPAGATLSAGAAQEDGSWLVPLDALRGLRLRPGQDWSGEAVLSLGLGSFGAAPQQGPALGTLAFRVAARADAPALLLADAAGLEDGAIALDIRAALNDRDGSEVLALRVAGLPEGARLSAGVREAEGTWRLSPAELPGLALTPPRDFSGTLRLAVTATAREAAGGEASVSGALTVTVAPVGEADGRLIITGAMREDSWSPLAMRLDSRDASEALAPVTRLEGLPPGTLLSEGTQGPDGAWTVPTAALLEGRLALRPPPDSDATLRLTLRSEVLDTDLAGAQDRRPISATVALPVAAVADAPHVAAGDAAGGEDAAIALDLGARLVDLDGSEALSLLLLGVPEGAALSAGTRGNDGAWSVPVEALAGLRLTPPPDFAGRFTLTLRATATEAAGGDAASTERSFTVTVAPVVDGARLVATAAGEEDRPITLQAGFGRLTDPSEAWGATAILRGVPAGAMLSEGQALGGGAWALDREALAAGRITLTPPPNSDADLSLTLEAEVIDRDGAGASRAMTTSLVVQVAAVADAPLVMVRHATVREDHMVHLAGLGGALADTDGSEALAFRITGLPDGASLNRGSRQPDGSWQLTPQELAEASLTPPANFAGTLHLTLTAIATEAGGGAAPAETIAAFTVTVQPVTDHGWIAGWGWGREDEGIILHASFHATDQDGSESWAALSRVEGLPRGAWLSEGREVSPGLWEVSTQALREGAVRYHAAPNSDADAQLTLRTLLLDSAEGMTDAREFSRTIDVTVVAVADAPEVVARDAAGEEDRVIALDLAARLTDLDGSEALSLRLTGVPAGASLSAGRREADGAWTLAPGELAGLALTPPRDFAGAIHLALEATASEAAGGAATTRAAFTVQVAPEADAARITDREWGRGVEDRWVGIHATLETTDADGSERLGPIVAVAGVPAGAVLSHGTQVAPGRWEVPRAVLEAGELAILPPANSDDDFDLRLTVTVWDGASSRETTGRVHISVRAAADAPVVAVADLAGQEDTAIRLAGLGGALTDTDGSETLRFRISGLPEGASLNRGSRQPDGSWRLTPQDLAEASLTPPADFAGTLRLMLTAIATEMDRGAAPAETSAAFTVTVQPVADWGWVGGWAWAREDEPAGLVISFHTPDADGSERFGPVVEIGNMPIGARLSHGEEVSPGLWQVPSDALRAGQVRYLPAADSDADVVLTTRWVQIDSAEGMTHQREQTGSIQVVIDAVADAPGVTVASQEGQEDTAIRLTGLGGALTDRDGSETLSFRISGLPAGASLSHGTRQADGSWLLSEGQLAAASLTPPRDFSGELRLTLTAIATEAQPGVAPAERSAAFTVTVQPVAERGWIGGWAWGREDEGIILHVSLNTSDQDGSESWASVSRVEGVPSGARLSQGQEVSPGVWEVSTQALRGGAVRYHAPPDSDADATLTIRAVLQDSANGVTHTREHSQAIQVTVVGVADAPAATARDVAGEEDRAIALDLAARLTDLDGSEALSLRLMGVPPGASLSAGQRGTDGSWTLAPGDLSGLTLTPPRDFSGEIRLTLEATATEREGGSSTTARGFTVTVAGVADAPGLRVTAAAGEEDTAIALRLAGWTTDRDGSERLLGFRLLDLPPGAQVQAGGQVLAPGADGAIWVPAGDAGRLTVTPPAHSDADFVLRVIAVSAEPNGSTADSEARNLPVRVLAQADAPVWTHVTTTGSEDAAIPLRLCAQLADADGSERLTYVIGGVPAGAVLSAGTYRGPGTWALTAEEAATATLTPPRDFAGSLRLTVTAIAQERDGGSQATSTREVTIEVAGVIDTRDDTAFVQGREDTPIRLDLAPRLADSDGSERLVGQVEVTGVPAGATLRLADGSVVVPSGGVHRIAVAALAGVTLTPPAHSDATVLLTVRATVEEAGGLRASVTRQVTVDVLGVADAPGVGAGSARVLAGAQEEWTALPLKAGLADSDGSESLHVWLLDVPEGVLLSAGTPAGGGTWLLRAEELDGLKLRAPAAEPGDFKLRVVAVAQEREGDTALSETSLALHIAPGEGTAPAPGGDDDKDDDDKDDDDGDDDDKDDTAAPPADGPGAPLLTVKVENAVEDGRTRLFIEATPPSKGESLGILLHDLPAGATPSAGTWNPLIKAWVLTPAELEGLSLQLPPDLAGGVGFRVSAVVMDAAGRSATEQVDAKLHIEAVADGAALSIAPGVALEDQAIALNLTARALDPDGSEAVVAVMISGLPAGARLLPGAGITEEAPGTWRVDPARLAEVRLLPPPDAHGPLGFTVTATTREAGNGATATTTQRLSVQVSAVADAPLLVVQDAAGAEDTSIALAVTAALRDTDGSEALSLVLRGLPTGARLSAGINNGDGSWTLLPGDLPGLAVTPPADWAGRMALTLEAHAAERSTGAIATSTASFAVEVRPVADTPIGDVTPGAQGLEDGTIALEAAARLVDRDGSESLFLVITGVPAGGGFSAGAPRADGAWEVPAAAIEGLRFAPPPDAAGRFDMVVEVTAREADGSEAGSRFPWSVTVAAVADAPRLTVADAIGDEDAAIPLHFAAAAADVDGSEAVVRYLIGGVPAGGRLSAGADQGGGTWLLTPGEAVGVVFHPPAHASGSFRLTVTAVAREESNGQEATTTAALDVTLRPVADAPLVSAAEALGREDEALRLDLQAALLDTDGSESLSALRLAGLPAGFTLSAGTALGGGAWALAPADLAGLRLSAPRDWNGALDLALSATSREQAGGSATTTRGFRVTLAAENDAPILTVTRGEDAVSGEARLTLLADAAVQDVDDTEMGGALITLAGAAPGEALGFAGFAPRLEGGRTWLGDTGVEMQRGPDGSVTLTGRAPAATYAALLESLTLEAGSAEGLASGPRDIALTLRDAQGLAAATQVVTLNVTDSEIRGDGSAQKLIGTAGRDRFLGTAGDEVMLGGEGADVFVARADGSSDRVEGGEGSWIDRIEVEGAGAPGQGWKLTLTEGGIRAETDGGMDFSEPASGLIQFADGGQVEFSGIERITW